MLVSCALAVDNDMGYCHHIHRLLMRANAGPTDGLRFSMDDSSQLNQKYMLCSAMHALPQFVFHAQL